MTGQQPPSRFPTRNYLLRQPFFLICLSHWDGFVCQRLFVSIPEVSISTRFFWTRLVWIFPGIFSNVVLWRKVFCKHVLQIKVIDPLLTFSKNSGNVFIDLLMVLLWLFFCKYFFTTGWTFLRFVLNKMYGIWGLQTKELYSVVNFTLVHNPLIAMNFLRIDWYGARMKVFHLFRCLEEGQCFIFDFPVLIYEVS